jgi:hypothetical protein
MPTFHFNKLNINKLNMSVDGPASDRVPLFSRGRGCFSDPGCQLSMDAGAWGLKIRSHPQVSTGKGVGAGPLRVVFED